MALGAFAGLLAGLASAFLSPAEREFARAARLLKSGDITGARKAAREYVASAKDDPLRAARLPAAEAFLAGRRDTLDVSFELEAAAQPAGRGTELQAAGAPEGRGTELLAGPEPSDVRRPPDAQGQRR